MHRPFRTAAFAAFALLLAATASLLAGKQDFVLVNKTGLTVDQLYVSSSDTENWEEDVLGRDVLPNGQSVTITFEGREKQCLYDLKIVDEDGDELVWTEIDLCRASQVTLKPKGVAEIQ
jgi:hypothetical protein